MSYVACVIWHGCGKLPTAEVSKWGDWRFCCEILALLGNFWLLLASSTENLKRRDSKIKHPCGFEVVFLPTMGN
jgi:hypothetical protein